MIDKDSQASTNNMQAPDQRDKERHELNQERRGHKQERRGQSQERRGQSQEHRGRYRYNSEAKGDFLPDLCSINAVFILIILTELLAITLTMVRQGVSIFDGPFLGMLSLKMQWIALCSAGLLCRLRPWLSKMSSGAAGAISFALVIGVALGVALLGQTLFTQLAFDWATIATTVVATAVFSGIGLRYLYLQQQLQNRELAEHHARIRALQARIRPHFLFNSLNSIASLITIDPDQAERMVLNLSALFRSSLRDEGLITLADEIKLSKQFIAIEAIRLGDRLRVVWSGEDNPAIKEFRMPSLLLQPLIENAIYHGIQPILGGGELVIDIQFEDQRCICTVTNPVLPRAERKVSRGNGIAVANIRKRLKSAYSPPGDLLIEDEEHHYKAILVIPTASHYVKP